MQRSGLALLLAVLVPTTLAACSDGNTTVDTPPQPTGNPTASPTATATATAQAQSSIYPATAKRPVVQFNG